jgi:hypothetical protein
MPYSIINSSIVRQPLSAVRFFGILFCLVTTLGPLAASAGTRVGNGGGAWICRDENQNIRTAEVIDLWEQREEHRLQPDPVIFSSSTSLAFGLDQIENKIQSLIHELAAEARGTSSSTSLSLTHYERAASTFLRLFRRERMDAQRILTLTDDSSFLSRIYDDYLRVRPNPEVVCPRGLIQAEQVANYTPLNQLLVRQSFWNHPQFGVRGQIALLSHEIVYAAFRTPMIDDSDSVRARHLNAHLLSSRAPRDYIELFSPFDIQLEGPGFNALQVQVGRYRSVTRDLDNYDDLQVTRYNPTTGELSVSELPYQRRGGINYHTFTCRIEGRGLRCHLTASSHRRLVERRELHSLLIEAHRGDSVSITWQRRLENGGLREVRYERLP